MLDFWVLFHIGTARYVNYRCEKYVTYNINDSVFLNKINVLKLGDFVIILRIII